MYKKIGIGLLCLVLAVATLPLGAPTCAAAEEATLAPRAALPSIEEQVRAYAKSIDQVGADDAAAWALATHGVTGRGKTLTVGADHSLTATLFNSNGGIATLVRGCEQAILYMHKLHLSCVFVDGGCCWYEESTYYTDTLYDPISGKVLKRPEYFYVTRFNNY
ncbi:MAG: hypothetical protein IKY68_06555, partial [Alistipes sp.]|nr:hypothetical protein [Alistipes sp.]